MLVQKSEAYKPESPSPSSKARRSLVISTPVRLPIKKTLATIAGSSPLEETNLALVLRSGSDATTISTDGTDRFWSATKGPYASPTTSSKESQLSTPNTSPSITLSPKKSLQSEPESPLLRKAKWPATTNSLVTQVVEAALGQQPAGIAGKAENDIKPEKLIRNMTGLLSQVVEENNKARRKIVLSASPNLDFSFATMLEHSKATGPAMLVSKTKSSLSTDSKESPVSPVYTRTQTTVKIKVEGDRTSTSPKASPSKSKSTRPTTIKIELENILPLDFRQRLAENKEICVASLVKRPSARCSYKAKPTLARIRTRISKLGSMPDWAIFLRKVEEVIRSTMCHRHQDAALNDSRIGRLKTLVQSIDHSSTVDLSPFYSWVDAIAGRGSKQTNKTATAKVLYAGTKVSSQGSEVPISISPKLLPVPFGFQPFQPKATADLSVNEAIRRVIVQDLTATDLKSGSIYIFWYKGRFGHVKIGRSKDPEKRLEEWNKQCKRVHEFHISSFRGELVEVAHASRVERLMHTELKDRRRELKCDGCGRNHREWFDVQERQAVEVFTKWRDWVAQKPYVEDHRTGAWTLRPDMEEKLAEVCRPVELAAAKKPVSRKHRSRTSQGAHGHNLRSRTPSGRARTSL